LTDVRDMGRALATVATQGSSWGRVWHALSNDPRTQAEAVNDVLASVGAKRVTVKAMPNALLTLAAPFVPILRELRETLYQFTSPYLMDSSAITAAFGPTPWDEVCRQYRRLVEGICGVGSRQQVARPAPSLKLRPDVQAPRQHRHLISCLGERRQSPYLGSS
jgi:nucleoside-diphosphate-sugar epimerase